MTDKAAIRELREVIEAGEVSSTDFVKVDLFCGSEGFLNTFGRYVRRACFHESLDAALGLHEEMLPGWTVAHIGQDDRGLWFAELRRGYQTSYEKVIMVRKKNNPAIALLIADLKAMEAEND